MSSDLIAFRRVIWNIRNYHKILWKNEQSDSFDLKIGNLKTTWHIILRHCETSNWIVMILRQSSPLLSDKITIKAQIKTPWQDGRADDHSWKMTKKDFEIKLINSKLFSRSKENISKNNNKSLILEIELTLSLNEADVCKKLATNITAVADQKPPLINDFTLICSDEVEVSTNKKILSERSPVFKVMVETDMVERKKSKVEITDIDSSTMRQLIDFLYTGSVDLSTGAVTAAKNLLYAAEKYELETLKNECHNVLMSQVEDQNVFEILEVADMFNLKRLEFKCLVFIVKNYSSFSKSEYWKQFKDLDIRLITKITDALINFNSVIQMN